MRVHGDFDEDSATAPRGRGGDSANEAAPERKMVTPKREHFGWERGAPMPTYLQQAFTTPISRVAGMSVLFGTGKDKFTDNSECSVLRLTMKSKAN